MSDADFEALFTTFRASAFRLETLQQYTVEEEAEELQLFRQGKPLPEYSPRTSPWLRNVAETTAAGKRWQRVHVVDHPLTEYLRWELLGYEASAAVGEEVRIADRDAHPELAALTRDFWLFDVETTKPLVVWLKYDAEARLAGWFRSTDAEEVEGCKQARNLALERSVPLADYLAVLGREYPKGTR